MKRYVKGQRAFGRDHRLLMAECIHSGTRQHWTREYWGPRASYLGTRTSDSEIRSTLAVAVRCCCTADVLFSMSETIWRYFCNCKDMVDSALFGAEALTR